MGTLEINSSQIVRGIQELGKKKREAVLEQDGSGHGNWQEPTYGFTK